MAQSNTVATSMQQLTLNNMCQVAAMTLFVYNFVLTFGDEVHLMHKRKTNFGTLLFLAIRYLSLSNCLMATIMLCLKLPDLASCTALMVLGETSETLLYVMIAVCTSWRVLAICNRSPYAVSPTVFVGLVVCTSNLYVQVHSKPSVLQPPLYGCVRSNDLPLALYNHDAIVIISTHMKTMPQVMEARRLGVTVPFSTFLFRESLSGCLALTILIVVGAIQIAVPQTNVEFNPLQIVFETVNVIFALSFFLEIRELGEHEEEPFVLPLSASTPSLHTPPSSPNPPTRSEHTTDPETSEPQTPHPPGPNHGLCSESLTQVLNVLPPSPSHCPTACFTGTSSLWNNRDRPISSLPSLTGDLQLYDSAATPEVNATYPIRLYLGGAVVPFSSFGFGNQDTTAVHSPVNADDAWIIRPRSAVAFKCPDPAVRPIRLDDNTWSCHSTPSVIITSTVISTPPDVLGLDDDVWSCHSTPFLETTSIFSSSESSKSSPPSPVQITLTRRVGDLTHSFHPTYPPSRSTWQEAILAANLTVVGISLRGVFGLQLWGGLLGALRGMPRLQRLLIDDMVRPQARIVRATTASCSQGSQDVRDQFLCDFIPSDLEGFNGSGPSGGKRIKRRVTITIQLINSQ